jgi:ATP-binding protein involved in chromosome partitioning
VAQITKEQVLQALAGVIDPDRGQDVVALDMVSGVVVKGSNVGFAIEVEPIEAAAKEPLRRACEQAVLALPGVTSATAVLTAERAPAAAQARPRGSPMASAAPGRDPGPQAAKPALPGIRSVVAVASGKGGVGKSTTSVNLALALVRLGQRVGLLDADIYGPSQPRMLGIAGRPRSADGKKLLPMENYGVRVMSMGFLVDEDAPMIWRGPMVQSALQQMLGDVEWGELDFLVVDLPPGTGDAQLTMAQRVPLAGAVIVSTPQDIALLDARKALNMFRKVDVPVLGIIENMSTFICPKCGERSDIFGHGGARLEAEKLGIRFLGGVPLHMSIRSTSDEGQPIVATAPESPQAKIYCEIAANAWAELQGSSQTRVEPPKLDIGPERNELTVTFDQGKPFTLSAEMLRVMSPSAEVQGHSPEQRVTVGKKRNVKIKELKSVGNYAVRIIFDDGHDTGLYAWPYLQTLDRERDKRWAEYLSSLAQKGLSRG